MPGAIQQLWVSHSRGIILALVIAAGAAFLSEHYGAPVMLFALLIGMAFHFLAEDSNCAQGIEFSAKTLLRIGVGLMGLRLSVADIQSVGVVPALAVIGFVLATLGCGTLLSHLLGRRSAFGLLAGGAVAICGASAALAITSVLPPRPNREEDTLFVVVGVTALSTIAMIAYPILFQVMGMSDIESGFLIGATIHDVAQVVGAGYSISDEAGVIATFVKMLRVALLPVVMLVAMASFRSGDKQKVGLPWFLVMFLALAFVANTGLLPEAVITLVGDVSRWCLIVAISALGVKTSLAKFMNVRPSYAAILCANTVFLLMTALVFVIAVGV